MSKGLTGDAGAVVVFAVVLELDVDLRAQGGRSLCVGAPGAVASVAVRHKSEAKSAGLGVDRIRVLRCRFCDWRIGRNGRQLAIGPYRAVFKVLLLPDRDGALQGVDGETAGVKGGGTMRSADGDEDAGFADLQAAQSVRDGDAIDCESFVDGDGDLADFGYGHGLVGFVIEIEGAAAVGLIADATVKGNYGAISLATNVGDQSLVVDGLGN